MSANEPTSAGDRYELWIGRLFGENVRRNDYGGIPTHQDRGASHEERLSLVIRLFSSISDVTQRFGDARIALGLQNLLSVDSSDELLLLIEKDIDEELRLRAAGSMERVFSDCFALRCSPHLLHLEEEGANPLNSICHMWWEYFPVGPAQNLASQRAIDVRIINVMKNCLFLPSAAVQESSLHGLGHWVQEYPNLIEPIIDGYIARKSAARPELLAYAKKARTGIIV